MARSLFSRLGTACLLYLYVINVIYLVPNKAVKKKRKKKGSQLAKAEYFSQGTIFESLA